MNDLIKIKNLKCYIIYDSLCDLDISQVNDLKNIGFSNIIEIRDQNDSFQNIYNKLLNKLSNEPEDSQYIIFRSPFLLHSEFDTTLSAIDFNLLNYDCVYLGGIFGLTEYNNRLFSDLNHLKLFINNEIFCESIYLLNPRALLFNKKFINGKNLKVSSIISTPAISNNNERIFIIDRNTCGIVFEPKNNINRNSPTSREFSIQRTNRHKWIQFEKPEYLNYRPSPVSDDLFFDRKVLIPSNGILKIDNGIIAPNGLVLTKDLKPVNELNCIGPIHLRENRTSSFYYKIYKSQILNKPKKFNGKCLVIKSLIDSNYGHNLLTEMPKIEIVKRLNIQIDNFDHIVLPSSSFKHHELMLSYLGINKNQILELQPNTLHLFSKIYAPTVRGAGGVFFRKNNFSFFRELFKLSDIKPFRKIFISRNGHSRNVNNEKELVEFLLRNNFEIIYPENETRNLQELFNESKIVIGVHGTNLSDACFCQENMHLIDILPRNHIYQFYMSVANANNLNYHSIICDQTLSKVEDPSVNIEKIAKILDFIS